VSGLTAHWRRCSSPFHSGYLNTWSQHYGDVTCWCARSFKRLSSMKMFHIYKADEQWPSGQDVMFSFHCSIVLMSNNQSAKIRLLPCSTTDTSILLSLITVKYEELPKTAQRCIQPSWEHNVWLQRGLAHLCSNIGINGTWQKSKVSDQ